jgi:hypothetical protein
MNPTCRQGHQSTCPEIRSALDAVLAAISDGETRTESATIGSVTLPIVRDWVLRFNARARRGSAPAGPLAPARCSMLSNGWRCSRSSSKARSRPCTGWYAGGSLISSNGSGTSSTSLSPSTRSAASCAPWAAPHAWRHFRVQPVLPSLALPLLMTCHPPEEPLAPGYGEAVHFTKLPSAVSSNGELDNGLRVKP